MAKLSEGKFIPGFMGADGETTATPTKKDYDSNDEYQTTKAKGIAPDVDEKHWDGSKPEDTIHEESDEEMNDMKRLAGQAVEENLDIVRDPEHGMLNYEKFFDFLRNMPSNSTSVDKIKALINTYELSRPEARDIMNIARLQRVVEHDISVEDAELNEISRLSGLGEARPVRSEYDDDDDDDDYEDKSPVTPDGDTVPHLLMQLKKAKDVDGEYPIKFADGTEHVLSISRINDFIGIYMAIKPLDREKLQEVAIMSKKQFDKILDLFVPGAQKSTDEK